MELGVGWSWGKGRVSKLGEVIPVGKLGRVRYNQESLQ